MFSPHQTTQSLINTDYHTVVTKSRHSHTVVYVSILCTSVSGAWIVCCHHAKTTQSLIKRPFTRLSQNRDIRTRLPRNETFYSDFMHIRVGLNCMLSICRNNAESNQETIHAVITKSRHSHTVVTKLRYYVSILCTSASGGLNCMLSPHKIAILYLNCVHIHIGRHESYTMLKQHRV